MVNGRVRAHAEKRAGRIVEGTVNVTCLFLPEDGEHSAHGKKDKFSTFLPSSLDKRQTTIGHTETEQLTQKDDNGSAHLCRVRHPEINVNCPFLAEASELSAEGRDRRGSLTQTVVNSTKGCQAQQQKCGSLEDPCTRLSSALRIVGGFADLDTNFFFLGDGDTKESQCESQGLN